MRGKFIVLDGIDGCGKGTQVKMLADYLFDKSKENHIFLTREPCGSSYSREIRKILKEGKNPKECADILTDLFVKDRRVHMESVNRNIAAGIHTICDRFKYSTFAYQQAQGVSLEKLLELHEGILIPDLAIIVDVSAEVALERIAKDGNRSHLEVFEQKDFQENVRNNFLSLTRVLCDEMIVIIDGNKPVEEVFESIRKVVDGIL